MKIELAEPYKSFYRVAYYRKDKRGRARVDLINSRADRTTVAYARYLVETSRKEFLESGYEVDHIDEDCSNDSLSNLQVLTREAHLLKTANAKKGRAYSRLVCPHCRVEFTRETRFVTSSNKNYFCSSRCNANFNIALKTLKVGIPIPEEVVSQIQKLASEGCSGYKAAKLTGVSRNTVLKYMKGFMPVPERSSKA